MLARSVRSAIRYHRAFGQVERVCLFIGYPRSGHSLVGSLLNAHDQAVIAHEARIAELVADGYGRAELFGRILDRDHEFGKNDRSWTGYEYAVPGAAQGSYTTLRVIGDKRGSGVSTVFGGRPELLQIMQQRVRVPVAYVHVVRHPLDNVATMQTRWPTRDFDDVAQTYLRLCASVDTVKRHAGAAVLDIHLADLCSQPERTLTALCEHVGLSASDDYVDLCKAVIWKEPKRTRDGVGWTRSALAAVADACKQFPHLERYQSDVMTAVDAMT
jgi:hypothetical protein